MENRYRLGVEAANEYAADHRVAGTPLLAPASWIPAKPIPLTSVRLEFEPDAVFTGVTGLEPVAQRSLPGSNYESYADAIADLAPPAVFENRPTYRLIAADLAGPQPVLRFGRGTYFDSINTGEAAAHEYAARQLNPDTPQGLRKKPGDAGFLLHWRDPAKVGHAGGLYQVVPSGVFQPTQSEQHDFSLWRNLVRELAEELLGHPEGTPVSSPFAERLSQGLGDGTVQAYCVGLGVDPLTFATDLLTVLSIDSQLFDELFGQLVQGNEEGKVLAPQPFTAEVIEEFVRRKPMQAAGAATLRLAWNHQLG